MKLKKLNTHKITIGLLGILSILILSIFLVTQYSIINSVGNAHNTLISVQRVLFLPTLISLSFIALGTYNLINIRQIIKLCTGYVLLNICYYFLLITRNINNPDFHITNFKEYMFWDVKATVIVLMILGVSWLINKFLNNTLFNPDFFIVNNDFQIAILLVIFVVEKTEFSKIFLDSLSTTLIDGSQVHFLLSYFGNLFLSITLLLFIFYFSLKSINDILQNKSTPRLAFSISLLLGLLFNYFIQEPLAIKESLLDRYIFPAATLYQIILLTTCFYSIYILINKFMIASITNILLGTLIVVINSIKFTMRNEPLLITDFIWIKQLDVIIGFIDFSIIAYIVLSLTIIVGLYLLVLKKILPGNIFKFKVTRAVFALLILAFFLFINGLYSDISDSKIKGGIPVFSKVNNWYDINWLGFTKNASYKSLAYVWTKQLTNPIMDKPNGYNKDNIKKIASKYEKKAKLINKTRNTNISDGTLIYILSESFSDPRYVPGVSLSQEVIPNIKAIKESTTSGLMKSDGYGGGTANMEFETLTGLPLYNFSSTVSTLYTEVVPKINIFPSISDQFNPKNRIAIHPQNGTNYMRDSIYEKLNFDKFYSLANTKDILQNMSYLGANVSDESLYKDLIEKVKNNSEGQFFSVITMQNHVPWRLEKPSEIFGTGENFTEVENTELSSYARLINATDESTKKFLDELSNIDKEVTVVFYGDHLPSIYPESAFLENKNAQYETDYFIWNNKRNIKLNYPLVNSSDFIAEVLEHNNSKVSPYYALLTEVLHDASVDKEHLTKEQKIIAEDLKLIQYDITEGKGYLKDLDQFFNISD